jgi:acetyltransferase-like isoleucine patch superfamily enzyme
VLTDDLPDQSIAAGIPARRIGIVKIQGGAISLDYDLDAAG